MMTANSQPGDPIDDGAELIAQLRQHSEATCVDCGRRVCLHELLGSIAMGAAGSPRCLPCLAKALHQSRASLSESLCAYFQARSCYVAAWAWVSEQQPSPAKAIPCCLLAKSAECNQAKL